MPKIIYFKLICQYHKNPFIDCFRANKIKKLIYKKYYLFSLKKEVKAYIKGCNIYVVSKTIRYKPHGNI